MNLLVRARSRLAIALVVALSPLALHAADDLAPGIRMIAGRAAAGAQPDGNTIVISAPAGFIVIDTGRHRDHTEQLLELAETARTPIAAVINSHWHLDHVGGNVMVRSAYPQAEVYGTPAIDGAMTGFLANYRRQLETMLARTDTDAKSRDGWLTDLALINAGDALKPTRTITASGNYTIAGRLLELHTERSAVTEEDLWVFDPATRTLIAGDLVTLPAPFFDTANPEGWEAALTTLSRQPFTTLVPGHGSPMTPAAFETYRQAFTRFVACGRDAQRPARECIDGWLRDAATLINEPDRAYATSLLDYYLDTVLRRR